MLAQLFMAAPAFCSEKRAQGDVYQQLRRFFPRAQWRFFDRNYEGLSARAFTEDFLPEFSSYLKGRGLRGISPGFSERQYAELCKTQLSLWLLRRYRRSSEAAVAILVADEQKRALQPELPTGWLLLELDGAWVVFDAARFTLTPLENFPHCDAIAAVQF